MKYRVSHRTEYIYGDLVPLSHNIVHLHPRDTLRQVCHGNDISVTPTPAWRRDRVDFFGNMCTSFGVQEPHKGLRVIARSEVEVQPYHVPEGFASPAWDLVPLMISARLDPTLLYARQFEFDSPYIQRSNDLIEYARPSFQPGRPLLDATLDLTHRIHTEFKFDSGVTTVGTPISEVLKYRHGVCQDFAHLMIGCLRSLGLAARYVSGYLVTKPPPGKPRLLGVDASHAWLSVFFPDYGWIDFDPTNGLIPSDAHITLGWARDYDDIGPVKGVIVGGHRHTLRVAVDVEPLAVAA